jgi:hypothetical protein
MRYCFLRKSIHVTVMLIFPALQHLSAQESVTETEKISKHSLNIEILGRTIIWGSLNYEYKILKSISIGSGLGFTNILKGEIFRDNGGVPETGKYLDIGTSQMIYANYFPGKNKHQLFFTAGLTNFMMIYRKKFTSGTDYSVESQVKWNAGIGYQFSGNKTFFRFTAYCIRMPDPSGWFPEIIPWAGISIGLIL